MDAFSQYFQQHYAWILTLCALVVAVIAFGVNYQRGHKALAYSVITDVPVIHDRTAISAGLAITYQGNPVTGVRLFEVQIENAGGKEIETKDFSEPLRFIFPLESRIYEAALVSAVPNDLAPSITHDGSIVTVEPVLMNPGDRITVRVLVANEHTALFRIVGRITGVREIVRYDMLIPPKNVLFVYLPGLLFVLLMSLTLIPVLGWKAAEVPVLVAAEGMVMFGIMGVFWPRLFRFIAWKFIHSRYKPKLPVSGPSSNAS